VSRLTLCKSDARSRRGNLYTRSERDHRPASARKTQRSIACQTITPRTLVGALSVGKTTLISNEKRTKQPDLGAPSSLSWIRFPPRNHRVLVCAFLRAVVHVEFDRVGRHAKRVSSSCLRPHRRRACLGKPPPLVRKSRPCSALQRISSDEHNCCDFFRLARQVVHVFVDRIAGVIYFALRPVPPSASPQKRDRIGRRSGKRTSTRAPWGLTRGMRRQRSVCATRGEVNRRLRTPAQTLYELVPGL